METLNSVSVALQAENITLSDVRTLFDGLMNLPISSDLSVQQYLSPEATIVRCPTFESGIIKIIEGETSLMSSEEKRSCECFKRELENASDPSEINSIDLKNYAFCLLKSKKKRKLLESAYIDCSWIPAHSCIAERAFSISGIVYSERRQAMHPINLERAMFLLSNKEFWNLAVFAEATKSIKIESKCDGETCNCNLSS
jgi:hypothetical protein